MRDPSDNFRTRAARCFLALADLADEQLRKALANPASPPGATADEHEKYQDLLGFVHQGRTVLVFFSTVLSGYNDVERDVEHKELIAMLRQHAPAPAPAYHMPQRIQDRMAHTWPLQLAELWLSAALHCLEEQASYFAEDDFDPEGAALVALSGVRDLIEGGVLHSPVYYAYLDEYLDGFIAGDDHPLALEAAAAEDEADEGEDDEAEEVAAIVVPAAVPTSTGRTWREWF